MTMNANYILPDDSMLSIEVVPEEILQHRISIKVQKGDKTKSIIENCLYKDDYVKISTYMSEIARSFYIKYCNYYNETTFRVRFSFETGEATLQNWSDILECDKRIEVKL